MCRSTNYRVKIKKRNDRQILGPCLRTKKAAEHEDDNDTNCNWSA